MKKIIAFVLSILMIAAMPLTMTVTAADTEPELIYTVDFRGDEKFAPVAIGDTANNFDFTASQDGTTLTIKGKSGGADQTLNYWGGTIANLTADETTAYTMIYKAKANGTAGKNNSVGVGGWIQNGDVEAAKFYNNYTNHNTVDANGSIEDRRAAISLSNGKIGSYVYFNTLSAYEEDSDGFITMKQIYDGTTKSIRSYILADNKTGATDADWIKIEEQLMTLDDTADSFGFMIYAFYNVIDTTIKDVKIYKQSVEKSEEPQGAATPNTSYDLVISEICNAPANDNYEFLEVVNTSDAAINLKDYYVFRFGFSHHGKWASEGLMQILGIDGRSLVHFTALSLEDCDVTLEKNEVAVLWFVSKAGADLQVSDFKAYWQNQGVGNLSNVKVVRVENYVKTVDQNLNVEVVTAKSPAAQINPAAGENFLPNARAGASISLVKATKANETVPVVDNGSIKHTPLKDMIGNCPADITQKLHQAADSIALLFTDMTPDSSRSRNFYTLMDTEKYSTDTADRTVFAVANNKGTVITPDKVDTKYLYGGLVCGQSEYGGSIGLEAFFNTDANDHYASVYAQNGIIFANQGTKLLPSPGTLWNGQFGTEGDEPVYDAAQGVPSIGRIPYVPAA